MLKLDNWSDVAQLMEDGSMSFSLTLNPKLKAFSLDMQDQRTGRTNRLGWVSFALAEDKGFNPMNHVLDMIRDVLNSPKHAEVAMRIADGQAKLRKLEQSEE